MPFCARLVLGAAVLFPTDARGEREAGVAIAVRCGPAFRVLAEKADERDAIFAKHVFVFLFCPDLLGRPGVRGPLSRQATPVFRRVRSQIVCAFLQKAQPAI